MLGGRSLDNNHAPSIGKRTPSTVLHVTVGADMRSKYVVAQQVILDPDAYSFA